jgi:lysophospholipase L1-like esterase
MKTWLYKLAPDVVLFYPSPQFYLDEDAPRLEGGDAASPVPHFASRLRRKAKIVLKSFLPGWLQTWLRQLDIRRQVRHHGPDWVWTQSPANRVTLFQEHLTNLLTSIQASGARALLLTHANRFGETLSDADREQLVALRVFYPKASDSAVLDFERTINRVVMDSAAEHGVPAVDVDQALGKDSQLFADFSHFTQKGATAMARLLSDEVERLVFATATTPQGPRP